MKKLLSLLFLLVPFFNFAQEAEKEKGFDQQIDEAFGAGTGWFVKGVFYEIPFGSVEESITIDLTQDSLSGVSREV
ncbi:MAG: D-alanine glycine permease, partial [Crocinitomicaceae bacterium]|nr:D-alanine glycine permease [Crocinitomicaceae bacterium]